jgi:hypothetical protein
VRALRPDRHVLVDGRSRTDPPECDPTDPRRVAAGGDSVGPTVAAAPPILGFELAVAAEAAGADGWPAALVHWATTPAIAWSPAIRRLDRSVVTPDHSRCSV